MLKRPIIKFGLVGAGAIAQSYLQAFHDCDSIQLVGIADVRKDAAEAAANTLGCDSFASDEELIRSASPDAIVVCTPPVSHEEICVRAVEQGVHVLCEKPLAINARSAKHMMEAARKANVRFSMASKFRHVDDVVRAKAIVSSGILGEIVLFENAFTGHVDMANRWNSDASISGGGVLIDNGTHSVDLMRFFLGPLADLQVVEGKRIQGLDVEDTVRIFVRTNSGAMGNVDLSWSINKELPYYICIYGSLGTVLVGWKESKYRRSSDDEWIVFGNGYNKIQAFQSQIENFAHAIRGEQGLVVTPEDALASVVAIEAAYQALQENSWNRIASSREAELNPQLTAS